MIEHLKSGLSVSTHVGCPIGCSYCVLSKMNGFKEGAHRSLFPNEIIKKIKLEDSLFMDGETPLIINNRTDPLLPSVLPDTVELLEIIKKEKINSPILLISKFKPPSELIEYFNTMNLIFLYSYSNIVTDFNFVNINKDLEQICSTVPLKQRFHYFRPIINGCNDTKDEIIELLKKFYDCGFGGSILSGLRVTSENRHLIPDEMNYDLQHKVIKDDLLLTIVEELNKQHINYPVFRHTSCAVSTFMNKKNKLLYVNRENHCNRLCSNYTNCCKTSKINLQEIIKELTDKFGTGFESYVDDSGIYIKSEVSQEQIAYIKNAYGIKVSADNIILSPSERVILKV